MNPYDIVHLLAWVVALGLGLEVIRLRGLKDNWDDVTIEGGNRGPNADDKYKGAVKGGVPHLFTVEVVSAAAERAKKYGWSGR